MKTCSTCSAPLKDVTVACPFCGTIGPDALAARGAEQQRDWQRAQAESVRAQSNTRPEIEQSAKWSAIASLAGFVCCFFPVGGVLGLVFGIRARRLAREVGLPPPGLATLGIGAGAVGVLLSVTLWVASGGMMMKERNRKEELRQLAGAATTLDARTACALAELELIITRYEGYSVLDDLRCDGATLRLDGDRAVLPGLTFDKERQRVEAFACFERRGGWTVTQVRNDAACDQPPPPPKPKR